jgi:hypothetical protein
MGESTYMGVTTVTWVVSLEYWQGAASLRAQQSKPVWPNHVEGWECGKLCAAHRGDPFIRFSASLPHDETVSHSHSSSGISPTPERAVLVLEVVRVLLYRTKPPKPRCDASCRGLRGTGVVISQCRERSTWGTRQHPFVFITFIRMGHYGWWPFKFPSLVGPKWRT